MGQRGAPADGGDGGGDRTSIKRAQETLGSVRVVLIDRGGGGGSERRVARVRRKIFGQGIFLLQENCIAVLVFQAVHEQGSRGVIFEQRSIVRIDLRAGRECSQTRVIEQVKTEKSSRFLHAKLREIVVQARQSVHCLRALQNFTGRRARRHQDHVRRVAVPERGAMKFGEERREEHAQILGIQGIGLHPLHEYAVRSEAAADGCVKFAREKRGDAGDPGIRRLGNDQVVFLARGEEKIARVVERHMHARVEQHVAIERREQRRGADDGRLDFHDVQALQLRDSRRARTPSCRCRIRRGARGAADARAPRDGRGEAASWRHDSRRPLFRWCEGQCSRRFWRRKCWRSSRRENRRCPVRARFPAASAGGRTDSNTSRC